MKFVIQYFKTYSEKLINTAKSNILFIWFIPTFHYIFNFYANSDKYFYPQLLLVTFLPMRTIADTVYNTKKKLREFTFSNLNLLNFGTKKFTLESLRILIGTKNRKYTKIMLKIANLIRQLFNSKYNFQSHKIDK